MDNNRRKILLVATGSVAALKIPLLAEKLVNSGNVEVKVIVTEKAKHFFDPKDLPTNVTMYDDTSEWDAWKNRGDPVLHIDLGKWADVMLIAPLDANTLAKMAQGICDNLVTCTTRAWDMSKPLIFCPAMNTRMWQHPVTAQQVAVLKQWGHTEIPPISKLLMCGDTGVGAMEEVDNIVNNVLMMMNW
ncbi:unnamed protein product [Plutella xylostella]|uniref:Phosphopantothenoylcysteine decarboxylase n=1 Tax=Plutella xylostella TaxID=51655 RepID=A0A8S4DQS0_PLUXY|nr:unnamed protein product [Plutella xylostella]